MQKLRDKKQEMVRNLNRAAIYDSAIALFKNYGFETVTMQQVADKADMAIGTLYNYFTNKEQIMHYVGDGIFERFCEAAANITAEGNALKKIELFSKCFFEFGIEHRALIKIFEQDKIDNDRKQKLRKLLKMLQGIIKAGISKNELKKVDPEKSAMYILSLLVGYNNHVAIYQNFDPAKESKEIVVFIKPHLVGCK